MSTTNFFSHSLLFIPVLFFFVCYTTINTSKQREKVLRTIVLTCKLLFACTKCLKWQGKEKKHTQNVRKNALIMQFIVDTSVKRHLIYVCLMLFNFNGKNCCSFLFFIQFLYWYNSIISNTYNLIYKQMKRYHLTFLKC